MKKLPYKIGCGYAHRDLYLKELGYRSYAEYLKSEDWKKIRNAILQEHNSCILCGKAAQVVHHIKYDMNTLLGMAPFRLASLCHRCHEAVEFEAKSKNSLAAANMKLFAEARKCQAGLDWCQRYYRGQADSKAGRRRSGRIHSNILREAKPWHTKD